MLNRTREVMHTVEGAVLNETVQAAAPATTHTINGKQFMQKHGSIATKMEHYNLDAAPAE